MLALLIALLAGLGIGWIDVHATEVQGSVLLLMVVAFAASLMSRVPAWRIAIAVAIGIPLAHLIAHATGAGDAAQWGMLVAIIPAMIAAYGGKAIGMLIGTASSTIAGDTITGEDASPWLQRPAASVQLLGAALVGCSIVGAVPVFATSSARGQPNAWWVTTWWQVVTLIAWALASPVVLRLWRRTRREAGMTPMQLSTHAIVVGGIAAAHAVVLPLLTLALFVPLGTSVANAVAWALAAYLPLDALTYCLIVGLGHASDASRRVRAAAQRESAARGELAATRLASLRAQLRPHFLFNALNAATVLAKRGDAKGAERTLGRLADLLRYVLRGVDDERSGDVMVQSFVRLDEELAFADAYLAIERERFPDRLRVTSEVTTDARNALVPHLLIQPLVENAVKHGIGSRIGSGLVSIRAWRVDTTLHVTVEDDGPGPANTGKGDAGIGLSNTRARLGTLYGEAAGVTLEQRRGGGAVAHVVMPWTE